jgi:hypothetical protein
MEVREVPAVVDVGVTQDRGVDSRRIKGKTTIALHGLPATPLEQAALHQ